MATTISPFLAVLHLSTITISLSKIPALIIESPSTLIVNTSFLLGSKYVGRVITSLGTSIASIGLPAVTFPNNGTVTTSSLLVSNSFGT